MSDGRAAAIRERLASVRGRIDAAARAVGRDPGDVTLVVVSKGMPATDVAAAVRAGARVVGESKPQELLAKQEEVDAIGRPPDGWHLIGSLQRNKVKHVVGRVALIHSIDSLDLAAAVGARATSMGVSQEVLLQVNVSGEATKHGVAPREALGVAREMRATPGLVLRGFMTIAAAGDAAAATAGFATLREIRDAAMTAVPSAVELSMGMSSDAEAAIAEGATMVRIGTAIFGPRSPGHRPAVAEEEDP